MDWSLNWIAIGAIASSLVVLSVAYLELIRPWRNRPKFSLEFENRAPYCRMTDINPPGNIAYWVRLKVTNSGRSTAKGCLGRLTKVMDSQGQHLKQYDPMTLHWVGSPRETIPQSIDIKQGEWEFLDFVHTERRNTGIANIDTDEIQRGIPKDFVITGGDYYVNITIYGDNVSPQTKNYRLSWEESDLRTLESGLLGSITRVKLQEVKDIPKPPK